MWTVHRRGSGVITVLFAGVFESSCVLTVEGRRSTPPSRPPRSPLSHAGIVTPKLFFLFLLYFVFFLFPQHTFIYFFLGQNTHTHTHTHTYPHSDRHCRVFSMNCGQQSVCRRLPCVKFALSCRSERRLVLVRPNSWIRRLSPLLEQICLITRFCG